MRYYSFGVKVHLGLSLGGGRGGGRTLVVIFDMVLDENTLLKNNSFILKVPPHIIINYLLNKD